MLITGESETLGTQGPMWKGKAGRDTESGMTHDVRAMWTGYYQSRRCEGTASGSRVDSRCIFVRAQ